MAGAGSFIPVLNAYRLYLDGTESGSTPYAAQDTAATINVASGDIQVHIRVRIDETGGSAGPGDDTWQLQRSLNGAAFTNVTSASSVVKVDTGSSLTNDGATTNRSTNGISDPAGTFQAGVQEEGDGTFTFGMNASQFTEHVYAIKLVSADLANGNTLTFRVSRNGGTPGFTHNKTPTINVTKINAYTLAMGTGVFTLTGNSITLKHAAYLAETVGVFTLTGNSTGLNHGYYLAETVGSFTLTGNDIALKHAAYLAETVGAFTLTGNSITLKHAAYLAETVGSFVLTGNDIGLNHGYYLTEGTGSFILTGIDVVLTFTKKKRTQVI